MSNTKPKEDKTPEKAEVVRIITPVLAKHFQLSVHAHQNHDAVVPAGTTKKDLLSSTLWNHVNAKIKMHDEIRVLEENGAFMARLFVHFKHGTDVAVKILEFYELDEVDYEKAAGLDDYEVRNRGAAGGWCVIDKGTSKTLYTGLATQSEAFVKREEHVAALGR